MIKILFTSLLLFSSLLSQTLVFEDDFESGLKPDWRVLKSEGGYTPAVKGWWSKTLRLTENKHWQSNGLTLDYEFPTKNNKFIVEFNHYAYDGDNEWGEGSYGGDGMAIILFDSLVGKTPEMGAFGGALGYAQMRNDDTGDKQKGFEGGWLGIGLDEYGNFYNHTEGKEDLDGTTIYKEDSKLIDANTVTIRGKQGVDRDHGYRKLASSGVKRLAKTSTWFPYSGHKFRLTVDSSDDAHLYIKLERDINDGKGYFEIISNFDAMNPLYGQGAKPEYFRLAFSASTGGASNYHDIDNVKIWADAGWEYPTPHISIADVNVTEGHSGTTNASFTVSLHEADPVNDTTIDFQTVDVTAQDESGNSDYIQKIGSITIPKGQTTAIIDIEVDGDYQDESNETFLVMLSNPTNGVFLDGNATGLIIDDDNYDNTNHYNCETEAYIYSSKQVYSGGVWYFDEPTDVSTIDLTNSKSTPVESSFHPVNINAIGYSVADNFIWGYDPHNFKVTRTDNKNNVTSYTIDGLDEYMYHIGDVSPGGILHMATAYLDLIHGVESNGIKRMYRVDVNPNSHTFLKELPSINLTEQNFMSADWAFHPGDEQLYMVDRYNFDLIKINPKTGAVDNLGSLLPHNGSDQGSHVQFFDRDGYFYFYSDEDFYRVDITDPASPALTVTPYSHLPLSSNGDAARCAYAPMENQISISDESIVEGNTTTQMTFKVSLDAPAPAGGMDITYQTQEGSAKAGSDYVKENPAPATVSIPAGLVSADITLDIVTDIIEEGDENFEVNLTSATIGVINDAIGIGLILNDDKNVTDSVVFNAIDLSAAFDWDKNISTKIASKPFSLTILAKNDANNSALQDVNITYLDLVDCSGGSIETPWMILFPQKPTNSDGLLTLNNLTLSTVHPCMKVVVHGNYDGKVYENSSLDEFAIRPDSFVFNTVTSAISGEDFNLSIEARDFNGLKVSNYNEKVFDSYDIRYEQQDIINCIDGSLSGHIFADFHSGEINQTVDYNEIGTIDINISENAGLEFAKIDEKDNPLLVAIPSVIHTMTFTPAKFALDWTLNNANAGYTIYSDDATAMGASLDVTMSAQNADGATVQNYSGECVAKDVNITVSFDAIGMTGENHTMRIDDTNITATDVVTPVGLSLPTTNNQFIYQTQSNRFEAGESHSSMRINFDRNENVAREPLRIDVSNVKVNDDSIDRNLTKSQSAIFYYARAHATDQSVVGKSLNAMIDYEVYCKGCDHDIFALAKNAESKDSVYWYILSTLEASLDFSTLRTIVPLQSINRLSNNSMQLTVAKTPHRNTVFYQPLDYLYHDTFATGGNEHRFKVLFTTDAVQWAGKGELGKTVDNNVSKGNGLQKIDW